MVVPNSNNLAIKSGISLFLAGAGYSLIAKRYSHISSCSTKAQIGAFAIAGASQYIFSRSVIENKKENFTASQKVLFKSISFMLFTGVAVRKIGFNNSFLKTMQIFCGCLGIDFIFSRIPKYIYEEEFEISPEEFHLRVWLGFGFPNRPIYVDGLDLNSNTNLTSLPDRLHVRGRCNLSRCSNLTLLPMGLHIGGGLDVEYCTRLTFLPDDLRCSVLTVSNCPNLNSIPAGLHLYCLEARECTSLISLPERLHVDSHIDLRGCTSLRSLPDNLSVGPIPSNPQKRQDLKFFL